jgi:hypothetical protein
MERNFKSRTYRPQAMEKYEFLTGHGHFKGWSWSSHYDMEPTGKQCPQQTWCW